MKKKTLLTIAASIVAVAVISAFTFVPGEVEVGKAVPAFSLKGIDGKSYSISDFKGKVVVLEWSNPNCPYVQRVYKSGIMQSVQKKYADKVVWLTVNSTSPKSQDFETSENLAKAYKEWNATFVTMLLDPEGDVARLYDAKTTPHMFIIDKTGKLAYAGAIDDDPRGNKTEKTNYVDLALTSVLEGKAVATTNTRSYGCTIKYAP
jgi:peroxiredoxin